jgi:hypothetical protein
VVTFIADHAPAEKREMFLRRPQVAALLTGG